jgi:hypothetical protein
LGFVHTIYREPSDWSGIPDVRPVNGPVDDLGCPLVVDQYSGVKGAASRSPGAKRADPPATVAEVGRAGFAAASGRPNREASDLPDCGVRRAAGLATGRTSSLPNRGKSPGLPGRQCRLPAEVVVNSWIRRAERCHCWGLIGSLNSLRRDGLSPAHHHRNPRCVACAQ